jgi:signal transduction histidine kinase
LDPVGVQKEGLVASIRELGRHVEEVYGVPCDFQCRQPVFLGGSAAQHLYHIAQEALTNAAKHAQADRIDIELDAEADGLVLRITDDGRGIDETMDVESSSASGPEGMGLRVMEYRARAIGARLTIEPGTEGGTVVECSLPSEALEKEPPDGETS